VPAADSGFRRVTFSYNVRSDERVDEVPAEAESAGGMIAKILGSASPDHVLKPYRRLQRRTHRVQRHRPRLVPDDSVHGSPCPALESLDRLVRVWPEDAIGGAGRCDPLSGGAIRQHRLQALNHISGRALQQGRHGATVRERGPSQGADDTVNHQARPLLELLDRRFRGGSEDAVNDQAQVRGTAQGSLQSSDHDPGRALTYGWLAWIAHRTPPALCRVRCHPSTWNKTARAGEADQVTGDVAHADPGVAGTRVLLSGIDQVGDGMSPSGRGKIIRTGHLTATAPRSRHMDLDDAILLLRDPRLGKRGMILAAKLAARELGPLVFVDGDEIWNTEKMTTDDEWIAFARFLCAMVRRRR
jgi:hypothetical protein